MTDRKFWEEVRRGLLMIVAAIAKRWLANEKPQPDPDLRDTIG